ncbi:hypothetical protein IG631_11288 [Alternaria alternata]|nr:hypothetical protein IG631_11288 [Alternaria alternata]
MARAEQTSSRGARAPVRSVVNSKGRSGAGVEIEANVNRAVVAALQGLAWTRG